MLGCPELGARCPQTPALPRHAAPAALHFGHALLHLPALSLLIFPCLLGPPQEVESVRHQLEQQAALSQQLEEAMDAAEAAAAQMEAELLAAQEQAARYQYQAEEMEAYKQQLAQVRAG